MQALGESLSLCHIPGGVGFVPCPIAWLIPPHTTPGHGLPLPRFTVLALCDCTGLCKSLKLTFSEITNKQKSRGTGCLSAALAPVCCAPAPGELFPHLAGDEAGRSRVRCAE